MMVERRYAVSSAQRHAQGLRDVLERVEIQEPEMLLDCMERLDECVRLMAVKSHRPVDQSPSTIFRGLHGRLRLFVHVTVFPFPGADNNEHGLQRQPSRTPHSVASGASRDTGSGLRDPIEFDVFLSLVFQVVYGIQKCGFRPQLLF